MHFQDEALLMVALRTLTQAVHKIDPVFHGELLSNIFDMSIWKYGPDTGSTLLELIARLAAVADKFLDTCLHMLVNNFEPHRRSGKSTFQRSLARKEEVHSQLLMVLQYIAELVPLAPMKLKYIIGLRMPKYTDPKEVIIMFVDCMLGLENDEIGDFFGGVLLAKVVDLLTDLDVNISWEDILQEDTNKGMFDMELEDVVENADGLIDGKFVEGYGVLRGNAFADKLDGLMVVVCSHLTTWASNGRLLTVFRNLKESFQRSVMNAFKSKFVQFVMFYACSLDPEICGQDFAFMLRDIFLSRIETPISRMSAVAYLASYLSRAKFVSTSLAVDILQSLLDWCFEYCQRHNFPEKIINPKVHRIFYSGCQAVMYTLCFHMRSIVDDPQLKSELLRMPMEPVLHHALSPLKVCLPSIVHEFLRQAKAANLYKKSVSFFSENLLESEFSEAFGGVERLDIFFPFDPYLLKDSDSFIRPNFKFWSSVKTTYSNCNSEDDEEFEDLDGPDFAEAGCFIENHKVEIDSDEDDDDDNDNDIELSMNKMSITPKLSIHDHLTGKHHIPARMPARIRPSVSP
ncbi:hypothetical protein J5N97_027711 [Dioscorea zingiberensis]|uniref:RNA polymerase I-specific transcription initiation factor RRN3 n=1 Tax=Dioscorea zingiberensis TaxID=325984 RepID=A0A9D5BXQ2_9LILI|nr:hypothetical protein J5N97_027711 [Dioscorea zingiberensis]